jgi:prolyl 4-hydroxylase
LRKGDLNKMFERILREAPGNRTLTEEEKRQLAESNMTEYTVVVYSRPSETPQDEIDIASDKSRPPWVITFENFLTDEECDVLIELGHKYEYKRSEDVGGLKFDGSHDSVKSERRTSENAWCSDFKGCRNEDVPTKIHNRMARVMGIPANNSEDMQLLRYEKGQFYRTHHDFIPHQVDRQCGPRILTFFLYLSDVEAGGGTNFPDLDITIMPKKGRALLWPSVLNADPMQKDGRMMHQALDVESGTKFAANGWIHMYDYVTAQSKGCN